MVLSGRRDGACAALRWDGVMRVYQCGAISESQDVLREVLPAFARSLAPRLATVLRRAASRWVAVGIGCDSSLEVGVNEQSGAEKRVGQ
jgi:hypothetical protein